MSDNARPMRVFKMLFISIVYFILAIILMEGITRLFFKITKQDIEVYSNFSFTRSAQICMPDDMLGYKLIPSISRNAFTSDFHTIYTTNRLGLREKEIETTTKFKILFLGDSLTFGEGVTYGSRFSDLIEQGAGNIYSINAGVPGYGIHQMYLYFKKEGLKLKPSLVICLIIPIDLNRAIYKNLDSSLHLIVEKQKISNPQHGDLYILDNIEIRLQRLLRKSYFYSVVRTKIKISQMWSDLQERDRKVWSEMAQKGEGGRYKITTEEQKKMVREESFKIFHDFKNLLRDNQIGFLVVNISKKPIRWLEDYLIQENIDYLDISAVLKGTPNTTFKIDPHYNITGNRIIANYLKAYILKQYANYMPKAN